MSHIMVEYVTILISKLQEPACHIQSMMYAIAEKVSILETLFGVRILVLKDLSPGRRYHQVISNCKVISFWSSLAPFPWERGDISSSVMHDVRYYRYQWEIGANNACCTGSQGRCIDSGRSSRDWRTQERADTGVVRSWIEFVLFSYPTDQS